MMTVAKPWYQNFYCVGDKSNIKQLKITAGDVNVAIWLPLVAPKMLFMLSVFCYVLYC